MNRDDWKTTLIQDLRLELAEAQKRAEAAEKEFADHKQALHPDWDQVEAAMGSVREHMAITKAAVERAEAAEAKLAKAEKVIEAAFMTPTHWRTSTMTNALREYERGDG